MGEMADYMINGDDCQICGMYMGEGDGYPRTCAGCQGDGDDININDEPVQTLDERKPVECPDPGCERRFVNRNAAAQHWVDKHK